jgi:Ni/Co efflux regulator RcnB
MSLDRDRNADSVPASTDGRGVVAFDPLLSSGSPARSTALTSSEAQATELGHRPRHHYLSQGRRRPRLRGPAYRYPPGFAYRRWLSGAVLPSVFLSGAYFYDNYSALRLGPPPTGYRWVRYGSDYRGNSSLIACSACRIQDERVDIRRLVDQGRCGLAGTVPLAMLDVQ